MVTHTVSTIKFSLSTTTQYSIMFLVLLVFFESVKGHKIEVWRFRLQIVENVFVCNKILLISTPKIDRVSWGFLQSNIWGFLLKTGRYTGPTKFRSGLKILLNIIHMQYTSTPLEDFSRNTSCSSHFRSVEITSLINPIKYKYMWHYLGPLPSRPIALHRL